MSRAGEDVIRVRRKPTEHEAIFYTGTNCDAVADWLQVADYERCNGECDGTAPWAVWTLHGLVDVAPGTWIVKGERDAWPVEAEQFEQTYDVIDRPVETEPISSTEQPTSASHSDVSGGQR